ncbi:MAG TPA: hypothetical protein PKA00_01200 [Saprospiraceae bacterium]|nr:hypothetical protein [Saprospiraceae bacterium]HMQ81484.1 hypothetical protein [Saprospiraceae bacterium]
MKYFASILLLASLLLPSAGTFFWLKLRKEAIRESIKLEIQRGIPDEKLVELRFSQEDARQYLRWEHDREFEFQGLMFDVISTKKEGDTLIYRCFWDEQESAINRQLNELANKGLANDTENKQLQRRLLDFFKSLYFASPPPFFTNTPGNRQEEWFFNRKYSSPDHFLIPSPPWHSA